METYQELLDQAYAKVKIVQGNSERFEIPKVEGMVAGKATVITNMAAIAGYLRRDMLHLAKFLQQQLAAPGKMENDRLVLNTKVSSIKVNEKVAAYTKEYVLCPECGKPDTEIIADKGIRFKHCLACGAKSAIKQKI